MAVKLVAAVCSDKGCVRQNNEDNFCLNGQYLEPEQRDAGGLKKCQTAGQALFAVCDGMGGEEAGEEASLLASKRIAESLKNNEALFEEDALKKFFYGGCEAVYGYARKHGNRAGTTVAFLSAAGQGVRVANMGDSRIYRLHQGRMEQISYDHTEMKRLLDMGRITPEQVKTHPKRHMIYQYWGMPLERAPFTPYISGVIPYAHMDRYLLCSDGLTDMLSDEAIASILTKAAPVEQICQMLVDQAKRNGGRDNVTVCVVEVHAPVTAPKPQKSKTLKQLYTAKKLWTAVFYLLAAVDVYLVLEWIDWLLFH
ncbi:MAG: serine/threonine-protein phosphatase [Clostridia bacterium]|nr:serine/threonine-protein phosphatase [Clostridia bacterium]